ncbi:condensin-2 complex subunit D3-like [Mya arenaria]|uniref:condensin-2 complex subunit D3-like n=1 Tax=Mya arenaria TaxID=6604 RepID=UPI0022E9118E|nr:condensin-2 complex subunit D3-like [Mya arenaria]
MAETDELLKTLGILPLEKISEDWVKGVWESDFTDVSGMDEDVILDWDPGQILPALASMVKLLKGWADSQGEEDVLWSILVEKNISLKCLQAYLAYLILNGHKRGCDACLRGCGMVAARVYVGLVQVPGSAAFKVFHPELYEKSLDYVKLFTMFGSSGGNKRKRNSVTPVKKGRGGAGRGRAKKKHTNSPPLDEVGGEDGEDEDDNEDQELAPQEVASLRSQLHKLLVDEVLFLERFSLRQSLSSSLHTVQVLSPLTRHEPELFSGDFTDRTPPSQMSVPALAFKGLKALCSALHGHVSSLMNATCKCLMGNLMMLIEDKAVVNISKQMQNTRDVAIDFVCLLLSQCGERGEASVRTLLQHMCTRVTDRAEYRTRVAHAIMTIAQQLPTQSYCAMVQWFHKLSRHSQIHNRGFALEIVSALLATPERAPTEAVATEMRPYITHKSLLGILLDRCSDKAPTVRARAITCFSQCLMSGDERIAGTVREIMTPKFQTRNPDRPQRLIMTPGASIRVAVDSVVSSGEGTEMTIAQQTIEGASGVLEGQTTAADQITPLNRVHLTPGFDPNLSDSEGVFSMLRRRLNDERVNVRKAALHALEAAVRFQMPNYTEQNLSCLKDHCRDPGLSVRKQALQSLTDLLADFPTDIIIQTTWLEGALPLVIDRESTLSEKCMETLEEIVISNVVLAVRSKSESHTLAWELLNIISKPQSVDLRRYLQKACHHWSRQGKIKPGLISALESHINTDNDSAAWMLLAQIAPAAPKIKPAFLLDYWYSHSAGNCPVEVMERVLTVMKSVAKHLPTESRLIEDLKSRLLKFDSQPELIAITVATLSKLCSVKSSESGNNSLETEWATELLTACDKFLSKVVLQIDGVSHNEDQIVCYLFTLGEVVQLCPGRVPKRVFLLVQSMIAAPCITPLPPSQAHSGSSDVLSSSHGSVETQGTQFTQGTQPLTQFRGSQMSNRVRAFAFITLGKLCLQHEGLAKKCIAALARELEVATDPAIRNNVMIVMCDLCVRYTTTANNYIINIASCLKDGSRLVRKQTLTLITRLLQEDFLKWKGALFFRFISTLLDESQEISKFAEFCLVHMLIQRHPTMFFQHFLECVFHFNDYNRHSVYNKFQQTERDRELFSLKGEKHVKSRMRLYQFMMEQMSDDHRFQMQGKLVQEVLGGVVDNLLPINDDSRDLIKDTLAILSSKEIKLSSLKVRPAEEMALDEQEMAAVVMATAKKTLITQVVKRNVIENIVPVVVAVKHLLEKQRSPLLKELLTYLRELMKDYKEEVKEILSADRQLATEIEYDLRRFEEEQAATSRPPTAPSSRQGSPQVMLKSPVVGQAAGITSPQPPGSPKTPALRGRGTPGSRANTPVANKGTPPVLRIITPKGAVSRPPPLSTVALLNSARRAMPPPDPQTPKQKSPQPREKTPQVAGKVSRAISTPSVAMSNITFHGDANVTFMPPSPIAEDHSSEHVYDESSLGISGAETEEEAENVLILQSPMAKSSKPRMWNVTSPAPKNLKKIIEAGEEEAVMPLAEIQNVSANQSEDDMETEQLMTRSSKGALRTKQKAPQDKRTTRKKAAKHQH